MDRGNKDSPLRTQRGVEGRYFTLRSSALSAVFRIVPENNKKSRKKQEKTVLAVDLSTKPGGTLPDVSERQFITGNCPMMYLSIGPNIHELHRSIAKLIWKY